MHLRDGTDTRASTDSSSQTSKGEDLTTVVTASWLIVGLFLDGYAHQHLVGGEESFFTWWHAVFYMGFAATAVWIAELVRRRPGRTIRDRIPSGYAAAVLGLAVFAAGGAGDAMWHTAFGVETGIDALLSPTHLVLFVALMGIVTAPYRASVVARPPDAGRWIPLTSLGIGTGLSAFFLNFVWGLGDGGFRMSYDPATGSGEIHVVAGVATALISTVVLMGAALFAIRLGRPRWGTFAILFGSVALAVHLAFEEEAIGVGAAVVAGAVLDTALAGRPSAGRIRWAVVGATATMWATYLGLAGVMGRVAWQPEIWLGVVVLASVVAGGLATLSGPSASVPRPIVGCSRRGWHD